MRKCSEGLIDHALLASKESQSSGIPSNRKISNETSPTPVAVDDVERGTDNICVTEASTSDKPSDISDITGEVKCLKPPTASTKTIDERHMQKTRSFSAVEAHAEKTTTDKLRTIQDSSLKDVSHLRNEQLETPSPQRNSANNSEADTKLMASSSTVVDHSINVELDHETEAAGGDTLIMQFDYYSNDQPMSLQNDPRFDVRSERTRGNHLRKSGHDLTELESEVARGIFDGSKANRSRPRLALNLISLTLNLHHHLATSLCP